MTTTSLFLGVRRTILYSCESGFHAFASQKNMWLIFMIWAMLKFKLARRFTLATWGWNLYLEFFLFTLKIYSHALSIRFPHSPQQVYIYIFNCHCTLKILDVWGALSLIFSFPRIECLLTPNLDIIKTWIHELGTWWTCQRIPNL